MTVIEYAEKLGIELTDSQKGILNIWQESDNKSAVFILSVPRCESRQMLYDLIQRYKGYEQGRADAIDELTKALCEYNLGIKMYTLEELEGIWADIREIAEQMKEQNNTYTATVDGVKREFM